MKNANMDIALHIALAWIMTRDHDFVHQADALRPLDLTASYEKYRLGIKIENNRPVTVADAWARLSESVSRKNSFQLRGIPYQRAPHINVVGVFDWPDGHERDIYSLQQPLLLSNKTLKDLTIESHPSEIRLRPKSWLTSGGHLWRDIETSWTSVLKYFPEGKADEEKVDSGEPPLRQAIQTAIFELWPNGSWRKVLVKERVTLINEWLRKNSSFTSITDDHAKTIQRVFGKLK